MEQQKIGNFLKQLRKEKGLTQEQFAERFYISSRTVSRWEQVVICLMWICSLSLRISMK